MAGIFSEEQPKTFRCLNCGEVINTAMKECAFCGVTLDAEVAAATANFQKAFDNACTEARTLKIMALVSVGFYLASWLPLIGDNATVFFMILFVLIPIMLGRWWMVYHRLQSTEERFRLAQRNMMTAIIVWGVMGGIWLAVVLARTYLMRRGLD
ncbi:MAG: hypothetical protein JST85_17200 [Acidobacteria bacterium]|nr:hypothetical protein [Acidobacteriota bacterium]